MPEINHPGERRLAIIEVHNNILIAMMEKGFERKIRTIRGLPQGAVFITSNFDNLTQTAHFVFYHPSFPIVAEGNVIPQIRWEIDNA